MIAKDRKIIRRIVCLIFAVAFVSLMSAPVLAEGYDNALRVSTAMTLSSRLHREVPKLLTSSSGQ